MGVVLDTAGAPIRDIHVIAISSDGQSAFDVTSGWDGSFDFNAVPPGDYDIATDDEYKSDFGNVIAAAKPARSTHAVAPGGDSCGSAILRQAVRARLRFKVTDLLTAQAISSTGASFRFDSHNAWNGVVNDEGELLVPPLSALEVHVGAVGYKDSDPIQVAPLEPGETREIVTALRPIQTGCVTGMVVDQRGLPVGGVRVQANLGARTIDRSGGEFPMAATDADGRFRFPVLQPGKYFLFTHAELLGYPIEQGDEEFTSLRVQPSQGCADITINLGPKAAKLRLRVTDAITRKPVKYSAWASGEYAHGGGWSLVLVTNPMPVPALKTFKVTVGASGYQQQTFTIAPLQPEESQQLTIALQPDGSAANHPDR